MLEEDLAYSLLPGLAPPHILQGGVEPLVGLDQLLNVAHQLVVLRVLQAATQNKVVKNTYVQLVPTCTG